MFLWIGRFSLLWILPAAFILMIGTGEARGWGYGAHKVVVDNARELLPPGLKRFFDAHARELRDYALEPDTVLKVELGKEESVRHYLNLDLLDAEPFARIPHEFAAAEERFGPEKMRRAGRLPWRIAQLIDQLTDDFKGERWEAVLIRAGHLSHYLADATQPLHATVNFDGQRSCNRGIHAAFEWHLVDRELPSYRKASRERQAGAEFIDHPVDSAFTLLTQAYPFHVEILAVDREAVRAVKKGEGEYFAVLEDRLRTLVEEQLARAGTATASFWMTAWINAGRIRVPY